MRKDTISARIRVRAIVVQKQPAIFDSSAPHRMVDNLSRDRNRIFWESRGVVHGLALSVFDAAGGDSL
jgi:hypothetical protein